MDNNENENENKIKSIKLIIVGSVNVGKTSLLTRYATGSFQNIVKSTSNASFISKFKTVDNQNYEIKLWDTAGQEKYRSLTKIFIKDAKIALLVYAIDDVNSFNDLNMWLKIIKDINSDNLILGIAANKADLYKNSKVSDEQGKKYAKEIGAEWRSTSSLLDDCGIDDLVDVLFNKYLEAKALKKTGSLNNQDTIVLKNINNESNRNSGCCGGNKKNTKNVKNIKEAEVIKNPDKYNDDEDF
jgi:small GTP-binding protein